VSSCDGRIEQISELGLSNSGVTTNHRASNSNQHVITHQPLLLGSEGFSDQALQEVSGHRVLDRAFAYNNSETGKRLLVLDRVHNEPTASCYGFRAQQGSKRSRSSQSCARRKRVAGQSSFKPRAACGPLHAGC